MKKTGRIILVFLSLLYSVYAMIYLEDDFFTLPTLILALAAFFIGWQYDSLKFYMKRARDNEESYKSLIESMPESIIIHHHDQILYVNEAAVGMVKASAKEKLIGRSIYEFILPDYYARSRERLKLAQQERKPLTNIEVKLKRTDNEVIFAEVSSMSISYGDKECVLTVAKDITHRREETDRLLQKSDKLALLGQMAAGIAHEIRNPLTSIKGFIQLFKADNDKKEYYDIVLGELERINHIVSEFLVLAKPSAAVFKEGDIVRILKDVITLINTQSILTNVEIVSAFGPDIPAIICEENQLKQVFINLLKNSIEAMPDGGKIYISVNRSKDGEILVKIVDEGMGIPEDRLATLGEPFYTTKEKGTGLGLMTCFKIIESHNGRLIISSKVDEGTSILILLPASRQPLLKRNGELMI